MAKFLEYETLKYFYAKILARINSLLEGKAASSHTHTKSQITDMPTSLKNPTTLTIQTNGTSQGAYDGSAAKTVNITAANVGAAANSHTHTIANVTNLQTTLDGKAASSHTHTIANVTNLQSSLDGKSPTSHASTATTYGRSTSANYGHAMASGATPLVAGTAAVGTDNGKYAREGHIHPAQTTVSGNAGTATKLQTARTVAMSGAVTGTATAFDGSANITIPTTAIDVSKATAGTLPLARGGLGATTAAAARANLDAAATSHTHTVSQISNMPTSMKNPYPLRIKQISPGHLPPKLDTLYDGTYEEEILIYTDLESTYVPLLGTSTGLPFTGDMVYKKDAWTGTPLKVVADTGNANGAALLLTAGGLTIIGGGESPQNLRTASSFSDESEQMIIGSDNAIYMYTGCQTIANRKEFSIATNGNVKAAGTVTATGFVGNASTATTLQNARTLKVGSTGKSFNGSANVEWTLSEIGAAPTSHASTATTYGRSTATNYGHAMASGATPLVAGTAAVGTDNGKYAREGHVHPVQTTVSGNAGSATKLQTARTLTIGTTGKSFDGSANVSWTAAEMGIDKDAETVTPFAFENEYSSSGGTTVVGMTGSGKVILSGPFSRSSVPTSQSVLGSMPVGFRPRRTKYTPVTSNQSTWSCYIGINSDGRVVMGAVNASGWVQGKTIMVVDAEFGI